VDFTATDSSLPPSLPPLEDKLNGCVDDQDGLAFFPPEGFQQQQLGMFACY
jgi:hypothetical protein